MVFLHLCSRFMLLSLLLARFSTAAGKAYAPPTVHTHGDAFHPDAVLRVTLENYHIGCIERLSPVVNGTIPGPELRFREGQRVWVRVYNDMDVDLTMHWHGISLAAAPFADGSVNASQFPICPHCYFDYELALSRIEAGTYFYHSHVGFQALTAFGPLIIEDGPGKAKSPYEYDDERLLVFHDLFNKTDALVEKELVAEDFVWTGEPGGLLVNGYGISNYTHTNNAPNCALAVVEVAPSKKYRLRTIGGTSLSYVGYHIDHHPKLDIIEADGAYTQLHPVDHIQLGPGERYSALLNTLSCEELEAARRSDFYITLHSSYRPFNITAFAILRYNTAGCKKFAKPLNPLLPTLEPPRTHPGPLPSTAQEYNHYALHPLHFNAKGFPRAHEVSRRLIIRTHNMLPAKVRPAWQFNGHSWTENTPKVPYLVALYQNETSYIPDYEAALKNGGWDPKTDAWPARIGEVLEIIIEDEGGPTNGGVEGHPMHMHGAHFYDIGGGPGAYDQAANEPRLERQIAAGGIPKRDTIWLDRYANQTAPREVHSWRGLRIRVQEAGVWMLHCHTLAHMIMGMQMVFVFGETKDVVHVGVPGIEGYFKYGGDVTGRPGSPPQVVHWYDDKGDDNADGGDDDEDDS